MFSNNFNYNKIVYLEILDNTIKNYRRDVLNIMCNHMTNGYITFDDYHNIYNKENFNLIKYYNYYHKMIF
jgi:hypothetical protein